MASQPQFETKKTITYTLAAVVLVYLIVALIMAAGLMVFMFTGKPVPDLQLVSGIVAAVGLSGPATAIIFKFLEEVVKAR